MQSRNIELNGLKYELVDGRVIAPIVSRGNQTDIVLAGEGLVSEPDRKFAYWGNTPPILPDDRIIGLVPLERVYSVTPPGCEPRDQREDLEYPNGIHYLQFFTLLRTGKLARDGAVIGRFVGQDTNPHRGFHSTQITPINTDRLVYMEGLVRK